MRYFYFLLIFSVLGPLKAQLPEAPEPDVKPFSLTLTASERFQTRVQNSPIMANYVGGGITYQLFNYRMFATLGYTYTFQTTNHAVTAAINYRFFEFDIRKRKHP